MDDTTPFPDDVPVDDAVEQRQSAAELDPDAPDEPNGEATDSVPPLESNPSDWQEQQQQLEDADLDDERR
jgi:hypothetical protein